MNEILRMLQTHANKLNDPKVSLAMDGIIITTSLVMGVRDLKAGRTLRGVANLVTAASVIGVQLNKEANKIDLM